MSVKVLQADASARAHTQHRLQSKRAREIVAHVVLDTLHLRLALLRKCGVVEETSASKLGGLCQRGNTVVRGPKQQHIHGKLTSACFHLW